MDSHFIPSWRWNIRKADRGRKDSSVGLTRKDMGKEKISKILQPKIEKNLNRFRINRVSRSMDYNPRDVGNQQRCNKSSSMALVDKTHWRPFC